MNEIDLIRARLSVAESQIALLLNMVLAMQAAAARTEGK